MGYSAGYRFLQVSAYGPGSRPLGFEILLLSAPSSANAVTPATSSLACSFQTVSMHIPHPIPYAPGAVNNGTVESMLSWESVARSVRGAFGSLRQRLIRRAKGAHRPKKDVHNLDVHDTSM